jgi:transposase-like protein
MGQKRATRNKRRTTTQWQALVADQVQSGLSVRAFCEKRGIGYSTLSKWKSRLADGLGVATPPTHFVEVSPTEALATTHWELELTLGTDIILRLARH